jgi:hypothetical protein
MDAELLVDRCVAFLFQLGPPHHRVDVDLNSLKEVRIPPVICFRSSAAHFKLDSHTHEAVQQLLVRAGDCISGSKTGGENLDISIQKRQKLVFAFM